MIVPLYMGIATLPTQMRMNMLRLLGTMMGPDRAIAYVMGGMMHAAASIVFDLIHVGLYKAVRAYAPSVPTRTYQAQSTCQLAPSQAVRAYADVPALPSPRTPRTSLW